MRRWGLTGLPGVLGLEFGLDPPLSSFELEESRLASSSDLSFRFGIRSGGVGSVFSLVGEWGVSCLPKKPLENWKLLARYLLYMKEMKTYCVSSDRWMCFPVNLVPSLSLIKLVGGCCGFRRSRMRRMRRLV